MYKTNLQIITELKDFIFAVELKPSNYVERREDFSRNRILRLSRVALLVMNLLKRSLTIELDDFFRVLGEEDKICSKSAFCQARYKIKSKLYEDWNKVLLEAYYRDNEDRIKYWKDFLLFGIDGSTSYLFERQEVVDHFGRHRGKAMARLMVCYDVLNHLSIYSKIGSIKVGERNMVKNWIGKISRDYAQKALVIYDSGFPSFTLMYLHQYYDVKFVMRCSLDFNNEVKAFVKSNKKHQEIDLSCSEKGFKELKKMGMKITSKTSMKIRLIKVVLDDGQIEVLLTSLLEVNKYPHKIFKDLYFLRWGCETFYDHLKNNLQIEIVSGRSVKAIEQDFYATIFTANIQSLIINSCDKKVNKISKRRKYNYKVNRNVSIGLLKNRIVMMFLIDEKTEKILENLTVKFMQELIPIRKGRSVQRSKFSRRRNGKYQTFTNYKRAI